MTLRDECMAPNRRQRALMLQMNVVERPIDQRVQSLLTLEKFGMDSGRATEPDGRHKQDGRTGESDEHKKRYSTICSYSIVNK
jgi:hypothetical protein